MVNSASAIPSAGTATVILAGLTEKLDWARTGVANRARQRAPRIALPNRPFRCFV